MSKGAKRRAPEKVADCRSMLVLLEKARRRETVASGKHCYFHTRLIWWFVADRDRFV
jgi:hypothetical protein